MWRDFLVLISRQICSSQSFIEKLITFHLLESYTFHIYSNCDVRFSGIGLQGDNICVISLCNNISILSISFTIGSMDVPRNKVTFSTGEAKDMSTATL